MSSELKYIEDTLAEKYPSIETSKYIWQELIRKQAIGVGWHELIIYLMQEIEKAYEKNNLSILEFRIDEIKEKYGILRISAYSSLMEVHKIIMETENKSESTCEKCGKKGKIRINRHWILTLCDSCNDADKG